MRRSSSPRSGTAPAGDLDEGGFSLIEVLVAMAIMSLVGIAILTGLQAASAVAVSNRSSALAEVAARNFANAVDESAYTECGSVSAYSPAALDFTAPPGAVVTVLAVGHWNGSSPAVPDEQLDTAFPSGCATDEGLQRITFRADATVSGRSATRTQSVLKRFEGGYPEPAPVDPPPVGWNECTIRSSDVQDTWVNEENLSARETNYGAADEMNILYRQDLRRFSYLRFDVRPGIPCEEDPSSPLPADANIRSVRLSLYTFDVGGAPACDGSCWHVLERVPAAWDESTLTWDNQPCPRGWPTVSCETVQGRTLFPHGGRQRHALFQVVTSPSALNVTALLDDVRSFFANPAQNHGWVIKEACGTYGKPCGTIRPGFQMRTQSAAVEVQRPTLTLVYR